MYRLVKLEEKYKPQLFDMLDEWYQTGEKIVPYAIRKNDYHDFENYIKNLDIKETDKNTVASSTYFFLDGKRNIFVGAVNIRHTLNDSLLLSGGHIGDGVRPSERNKGIGTKMIASALQICKELGIKRVLMTCDKSNIASAKTIIKNGGILENEVIADDTVEQRYWIENS